MRSLVRQTIQRLEGYFRILARLEDFPSVSVHQLMGGSIGEAWESYPDHPWILVGTQDQLLSRALNRGYSMDRFRWPVRFGLLNQDCHWVIDEIQLMGPGLWTTAQLDWMRCKRFPSLKPCRTTWMSATIGTSFLGTADRKRDGLHQFAVFDPQFDQDQSCELKRRLSAKRPVESVAPPKGKNAPPTYAEVAARAQHEHRSGALTLIVCNTIKTAQAIFKELGEDGRPKSCLRPVFAHATSKKPSSN
jgi:CRISPR-associated endonuclease/helicase Cas3